MIMNETTALFSLESYTTIYFHERINLFPLSLLIARTTQRRVATNAIATKTTAKLIATSFATVRGGLGWTMQTPSDQQVAASGSFRKLMLRLWNRSRVCWSSYFWRGFPAIRMSFRLGSAGIREGPLMRESSLRSRSDLNAPALGSSCLVPR